MEVGAAQTATTATAGPAMQDGPAAGRVWPTPPRLRECPDCGRSRWCPRSASAPPRAACAVLRRHGKPQHLGYRLGVDAEYPGRLPLAHPLHMAGTPNPRIKIHDFHPQGLPSAVLTKG